MPGMARVTSGAANKVTGIPTTATRPKCHATRGRVAKVAATPAATPEARSCGRRTTLPVERLRDRGRTQTTRPRAPAKES